MHFTSWVFPKGHRIRLAVNNAQWPMLWPTPEPMTTTLRSAARDGSRCRSCRSSSARCRHSCRLRADPPIRRRFERSMAARRSGYGEISSVDRNPQTGAVVAKATNESRHALSLGHGAQPRDHPLRDQRQCAGRREPCTGTHRMEVELPGRKLVWDAELTFRSDRENFHYSYHGACRRTASCCARRPGTRTIPRDYQ